eukprot:727382-Prymnesium_polylepis.4
MLNRSAGSSGATAKAPREMRLMRKSGSAILNRCADGSRRNCIERASTGRIVPVVLSSRRVWWGSNLMVDSRWYTFD